MHWPWCACPLKKKSNCAQSIGSASNLEKVNPDLVARDADGKAYTVRYEAVNAMLLNEFLKQHREFLREHRKVEEQTRQNQQQEVTISELKSIVAQQQKEIKALSASLKEEASQIQKVTAQLAAASPFFGGLEARKSSPQIVLNNQ
jgi:hypothetical protein